MGSITTANPLFQPLQLGALSLSHRVVLAPCTRMRATKESDGVYVPNDLMAEYYSQRASPGGLLITEATPISRYAAGYPGVPGIFTPSQIASWKTITSAVHSKGGLMISQLWHVGRATVPSLLDGQPALAPSSIPITGTALDGSLYADNPPKPMSIGEIQSTIATYATAASNAMAAGFDAVEIHAANGYLLDQFLHDNVNTRTDEYGGSVANRARIVLEVIEAVSKAIGSEKVGVRLSPYNYFQDTRDSNPQGHWVEICELIAGLPDGVRPAYVHMVEPRFDEVLDESAKMDSLPGGGGKKNLDIFRRPLKEAGVGFIAAGAFNGENAKSKVLGDGADAVAFGRWFIANPDLPRRLLEGVQLNKYDRGTFYGADPAEKGYTDYPVWE
ncbi:12-oxophytodienoate reductase [Aspergillus sclerotioniger CBS 115572]|uniref:12-oxophytodienoate reductase n=1 Tax=Aspergillus sclerotioniger CBS 115572 TaxID=1450535 RepID=A0A317VT16_9EURO|nr:12-oxophytodienoate reductase [Aspergillus sclerotioniger CBS 115572]PWY76082.1 12-oxophytodienoate reductase [Aspergillus sclerotioniger CBS 115572]